MKKYATNLLDFYKTGHGPMFPSDTQGIYANFTLRSGNHSNTPNSKGAYVGGQQLFFKSILQDLWNETFFGDNREKVVQRYARRISEGLQRKMPVGHMYDLYDLGYLPIKIKSLPEGSFVPYKIPYMTMRETIPEFFWFIQMIESVMSNSTWPMINSMSTAAAFLKKFYIAANTTGGNMDFVPFQTHDFSYRGMFGPEAGAMSGLAMLLAGVKGTDTVPALDLAEDYYHAYEGLESEFVGGSIPATEHSVMCAAGKDAEFETFVRIIEMHPDTPISIVMDTWDTWKVMGEYLPKLKPLLETRKNAVVFRPDSGVPEDIICGDASHSNIFAQKGIVQCLWDVMGGTINDKGYKVLNPLVNTIYGDSITLQRQDTILRRLIHQGFCPTLALGIGSYSAQGNSTRDTHGIAMKATNVIRSGKSIEIFKDPITDDGTKRSLKGLVKVSGDNGAYTVEDQVTPEQEQEGELKVVFEDGKLLKDYTLYEVRNRVTEHILKSI